ncbi:related to hsp70 protein [Phialocephala subalpina]|uniref:Related to hsp70 protein n=1 Tax=Phialocephala subalpina TaxID=576137 RepID=A0A1L7WBU1_9HELO|nr:related to hsp70 protein [Phialocephala subalpina]
MEQTPDLVVGIDFGMTYTGVAWTNLLTPETFVIKDWPGLGQDAHETKVPSKIIYARNQAVGKWGFLCDTQDDFEEQGQVFEWFKIYLDQTNVDRAKRHGLTDTPSSVQEAKKLTTDYLREVYNQTKRVIEMMSGPWTNKRVEFIFSMPTTWTSQAILNEFKAVIRDAGFGSEQTHTAKLELTEAEAVAVYTVKTAQIRFQKGDIFLVCDAGGGTTDLGLVEIAQANPDVPVLRQVAAVQGVGIGSTVIDRAFQALVQRKIDQYPDVGHLLENLAFTLSRSQSFRSIKHNFGTAAGDQATFYLPIDINRDFNHPGLGIARGRMAFSKNEIQGLFDPQINQIIARINKQFNWMQENRSAEVVKYMVLSGGLGGSEYVRSQVEQRYKTNPHMSAPNLYVFKSQEPRLAVAKGLVMDRRQKLVTGASALKTRIARASYGVLCREPYDPNVHVGEEVEFDQYIKGKRWAINQIEWFIRKGDVIDTDWALERRFERKLKPGVGSNNRIWESTVIISHNDRASLPRGLRQAGAKKLCVIKSDLRAVEENEFEVKNKHCWQGRRYYLAKFQIKVMVAPADLKFELWFKGTKYSRSHDPVTIQWDPAGANEKPPEQHMGGLGEDDMELPSYRPASRMNNWGNGQQYGP